MDNTYEWSVDRRSTNYERITLFERQNIQAAALIAKVQKFLSAHQPSAVLIPGWNSTASLASLDWCKRNSTKAILMCASSEKDFRRNRIAEFAKSRMVRNFDAAVVGGSAQADYVKKLGLSEHQIFRKYNVVDNTYFHHHALDARSNASFLRASLRLPDRFFLTCSRLVPKKNIDTLLVSYAKYRGAVGPSAFSLVIVGDGPERETLEKAASRLGIADSTQFVGFVQYGDLPKYYALAECFLLLSTSEQWGLVVNEAMASMLPVIVSTQCGCVDDLVYHSKNGYRVSPFHEGQITQRLVDMTAANRIEMGHSSLQIISGWSPTDFASNAVEAIDSPRGGTYRLSDRLLIRWIATLRGLRG